MASSLSETTNDLPDIRVNSVLACLRVAEIFDVVLEILEMHWESQTKQGMTTIAALAATCRLFHEPSMDYLWKMVPDLTPIIMCLPSHLWYFDDLVKEEDGPAGKRIHTRRIVVSHY